MCSGRNAVDRGCREASLVVSGRVPAIAHKLGPASGRAQAAERSCDGRIFAARHPINTVEVSLHVPAEIGKGAWAGIATDRSERLLWVESGHSHQRCARELSDCFASAGLAVRGSCFSETPERTWCRGTHRLWKSGRRPASAQLREAAEPPKVRREGGLTERRASYGV